MKKQSNLLQFFQVNSQSKPKSGSFISKSSQKEDFKIEFKNEPSSQENPQKCNLEIEEDDEFLNFKTLKKHKTCKFEEEIYPEQSSETVKNPAKAQTEVKAENKENIPKMSTTFSHNKEKMAKLKSKQNSVKELQDDNLFVNVDKENNQGDKVNFEEFEDKTPWWALKENCKDKQGRSPSDPDYDPSTLWIPPEEKKRMTPTMRQYWEMKADNYDKVCFFKLGKFYELFYDDAVVGNQVLDLNWMGRKMHTGFPEKALERYAQILVNKGYVVAVIEQMETPKQMEERLRLSGKAKCRDEKTIHREVVEVMTRGTYVTSTENTLDSRFLFSIRVGFANEIGFCALESISNFITLGHIIDDENYTNFKTLLCQIKPIEIVYDPENINKNLLKILKAAVLSPLLSPQFNKENKWHSGVAYNHLEKLYGFYDKEKWPPNISYFYENKTIRDLVFSSLSGCFSYLEKVFILEKVLAAVRFAKYDQKIGLCSSMILDSQALQHLEIFENSCHIKTEEGTLFSFIDKTVSPGGKRMLKRWVCAPCLNVNKINSRLDAIEDLQKNIDLRDRFRKCLKELPDLERMCSRIYKNCFKQNNGRIVYFEDMSAIRLREFKDLMNSMVKAENLVLELQSVKYLFKSKRLKQLVTYSKDSQAFINPDYQDIYIEDSDTENEKNDTAQEETEEDYGLLPNIIPMVQKLNSMVIWEGKDNNTPAPVEGLVPDYDHCRELIKEREEKLNEILQAIRKRIGDNAISYCHAKFRYEIEVPERHVRGKAKPEEFEFSSARNGFQRFRTKETKELVNEIEDIEEIMKKNLKELTEKLFKYFREKYHVFDSFHAVLHELDCLIALSLVSFQSDGSMCRPDVFPSNPENGPFIIIEEARHPSICQSGVDFIPNDIYLGNYKGIASGKQQNLMLLTGPNMGGKSTLLRMVSCLAILAQIGCYVPAKLCKISIVDRIFTRIGASDKLLEGKSTFFIEMEETLNIVKSGTINSLAIIDELGRGTSTFDGVALAYSVLKYLVENIRCRTIFATHYHMLNEEFRMYPEIEYYHMDAIIDEENEKVIFLYKLKEGMCHHSFALNVAKVEKKLICFFLNIFWLDCWN